MGVDVMYNLTCSHSKRTTAPPERDDFHRFPFLGESFCQSQFLAFNSLKTSPSPPPSIYLTESELTQMININLRTF